jgi:hypothetical protein
MDHDINLNTGWTMDRLLTNPGEALDRLRSFAKREQDLLEANNLYLELARKAEAEVKRLHAAVRTEPRFIR